MKGSRDTFLHFDNAIPHRTPRDFDRLGIPRLSDPLYRQDLVLCDFWLFRTLKRMLEGSTFENESEVLLAVNTIFSTTPREEFVPVFDERKSRLRECMDRGGEYL
jgi:hypothetical protein